MSTAPAQPARVLDVSKPISIEHLVGHVNDRLPRKDS